jgi:hypothetical protein
MDLALTMKIAAGIAVFVTWAIVTDGGSQRPNSLKEVVIVLGVTFGTILLYILL